MFGLAETFTKQSELINLTGVYKNELETIKLLHILPADRNTYFNKLTQQLLGNLEQPTDKQICAERSRFLREEGNRVYKSKSAKNVANSVECLLAACRLYTQAILAAENAYDELSLGYANRGMALQDFGYFEQAYDDCAAALDSGYPQKLQHKLIMRQAHCAWKMGDARKLEEHLSSLRGLELNQSYRQQLEQLKQQLKLMENTQRLEELKSQQQEPRKTHEIIRENGSRGRHMLAKELIPKGDQIFKEQAKCFVPIEQRLICQRCASVLMCAPIPCPDCHQRVVYCSRRCRQLHATIHSYECAAYRCDLLKMLGVSHLALRLLLTYLPQLLSQLHGCKNATEIWQSLMSLTGHDYHETAPQSVQSLNMISHLDKASPEELVYHTLCANLLQVYLHKCTNFYDVLKTGSNKNISSEDWHLVIAALILRFAGQLLVNGHVADAIIPISLPSNEFALLQPSLWQSPHHLRLGFLHKLSQSALITAINLPYLSLCNHACSPSIRTRFDGCTVSNFAAEEIKSGEEIFNCYTLDCRNSLSFQRQAQLQDVYKFNCCCNKCQREKQDQDYFKFHRYRCERSECQEIFVPHSLPNQENCSWWLQPDDNVNISCSICGKTQLFTWYDDFLQLLEHCQEPKLRRQLYKAFDNLNNWLLDYHSLKLSLAKELIEACFAAKEGVHLNDFDYGQLSSIIEFQLAGIAAQSGNNSLEYISKLTYLLDLIAWKKHKCHAQDLKSMRSTFEYLSEETRRIFVNYYNDFIEQ
ncbi:SET and MYND domain-containing protein 4 isoform X2 [Drosophila innubila]|uniref:SET and MYND domain-containing protein 4 isoform X2 n=1 Tax=Drosophila innubila TaxID=198719 RepID=UPI00148CB363|nr:SET and MYND domain-containing protein 4 isoform X2 [Drosophila innubila]